MNNQLEERIAEWLFNSAREASGLPELAEIPHNHAPYWVNKAKELMALIFDDNQELPSVKPYENWVDKVKEAGRRKVRE